MYTSAGCSSEFSLKVQNEVSFAWSPHQHEVLLVADHQCTSKAGARKHEVNHERVGKTN